MSTSTRDLPLTLWPDTSNDDPPVDWLYKSATWLLGRHPMLAELAARAKIVYLDPDDQELSVDMPRLTEGFGVLEDWQAQNATYWKHYPEGSPDDVYDRWESDSPRFPDTDEGKTAKAIAPMSGSEVTRLRLLATFSHPGARINVSDFGRMDGGGQRLLKDWMTAAMAA